MRDSKRNKKSAIGSNTEKKTKKTRSEVDPPMEEARQSTVILEGVKKVGPSRKGSREIKPKGLSLEVKFALVISLVSACLCLVAELKVYFNIKEALIQEIDRKGAAIVKSIANLGQQYFDEYQSLDKAYKASKQTSQDEIQYKNDKDRLVGKYSTYLNRMVAWGEGDKIIYSTEILNVAFVMQEVPIPSLQAGGQKETMLTGKQSTLHEKIRDEWYPTDIKVIEGEMTTDSHSVRVKTYCLPRMEGKLTALVMLSENDIKKTTDDVLLNIAITTLIAICIGIAISLLLARHVTHPLRHLMRDIEAVAAGDLSHKTIPVSEDEIGILAHTFNVMTHNLKLAHESELEKQAREHELKIATEIQYNLLPSAIPQLKGYDIFAYYNPSKEVGGDYYDFIEIDKDHMGFAIADVSGKGIPGSMVMTMTRSLIRMEALRNISPSKTFVEVNKILAQDIRRGMFVTAMYGVLSVSTGELIISSAGHNPAVVWRKSLGQNELVNPKGMALGLDKGNIFEKTVKEQRILLNPGDRVVFYTDGVSEAMSPSNEEFGDERFFNLVAQEKGQSSNHLVDTLVRSLEQWKGNGPQSDDITILTFMRTSLIA